MSEFENVGDFSGIGTITVLNGTIIATTNGCSSVVFNITGTWVATLIFEATVDNLLWFTVQGVLEPVSVVFTTITNNQTITINCGGFQQVRVRASLFTSGTINIAWNAGNGNNAVWVYNINPLALNATVKVTDGVDTVAVNSDGSLTIQPGNTQNVTPWLVQSYKPASLIVTATGTAGSAVTATLPVVATNFHYITMLEIVKYATATITGTATPTIATTTNLAGNPAFTFGTAQTIGTTLVSHYESPTPLKSSVVGTATTIICPATTSVIWRVNIFYFVGI